MIRKKSGYSSVDIKALEQYLESLSDYREYNKVDAIARFSADQQRSIEMLRSVFAYGQAALKSATLINGGAAVALLAFIGKVMGR